MTSNTGTTWLHVPPDGCDACRYSALRAAFADGEWRELDADFWWYVDYHIANGVSA